MPKKSKFKIPPRSENKTKELEKKYKKAMIEMLDALYPKKDYGPSSFFQRISVTDCINPVTDKKEYGIVFMCQDTLFSIVQAPEGIDKAALSLCLEGLAAGMFQCDQVNHQAKEFDYKYIKGIVYESIPEKLDNDYVYVDESVIKDQVVIFQVQEYQEFKKIFASTKNEWFPIRVFNSETNPKASECFEETKKLLKIIPNRRTPRI